VTASVVAGFCALAMEILKRTVRQMAEIENRRRLMVCGDLICDHESSD